MNINNRLLRVSLIASLALAAAPAVPNVALAAGQSFDRCESVAFQGNVLAPGRDTFFDGYVAVDNSGKFSWQCTTESGAVTEQWTHCGNGILSDRRARGELRGSVFYLGCA